MERTIQTYCDHQQQKESIYHYWMKAKKMSRGQDMTTQKIEHNLYTLIERVNNMTWKFDNYYKKKKHYL